MGRCLVPDTMAADITGTMGFRLRYSDNMRLRSARDTLGRGTFLRFLRRDCLKRKSRSTS